MPTSSLRLNIIANFIGRFWATIIGIVFVPIYIYFIGIEAYGLLGVFATFQTILTLLDMGLSTTLNRELAKFNATGGDNRYMNNLVFTMEMFYVGISLLTALILIVASWFFAAHWVKADKLSESVIINSFILMAVNFAIQFPGSLYQGGLMGLQKQVSLNIVVAVIATAKAAGSILVLWLFSPTLLTFLTWQICLSVIQLVWLRRLLWKNLPERTVAPRFDKTAIHKSGRYAAGIMGISILSIILTQSDKIILSNLVLLTEFGYYTLAATIAGALSMILFPVTGAVFPRITELLNKGNKVKLFEVFHKSSQLVSLIIIPLGLSLAIFANDIIFAWTRNMEIARETGPILRFLVLGTTINSLMVIPYQYTLSAGWLRFGINTNAAAIIVFLPAIFIAVNKYGAIGGAFIWMILNICYLVFAMLYLFSRQLQSERTRWYVGDVIKPLIVSLGFCIPFYIIHTYGNYTNFASLLLFGCCLLVCFAATLWLGTPALRPEATRVLNRIRGVKYFFL